LHEPGRFNAVFDITACQLESDRSNRIVGEVRRFARESGLSAWGLKSHRGLLRYLVIREGKATGETMVNLVTSGEDFTNFEDFAQCLLAAVPEITTILRSINRSPAATAVGEERRVVAGDGCIHDRIGDYTFAVSPDSFFQTNTRQAANLYETIGEFCRLTGDERVLDLYCGTGTIGISLASRAASVAGIEQVADAVCDARSNARLNGIENIEFIAGRVEAILDEDMAPYDVVICDPPRAGIHPRAMDRLVRMLVPRMVYVSCNSAALPGDLAVLLLAGYRIADIRAFDMSPHTPHIETVVLLER
ncbi:23S rRNA (uracil(1939)-C(5))-methyltransferase RlmD, partial [Candidatus Latescibacterota bacterium]